jgi:plasmid stabilization system protein ParE
VIRITWAAQNQVDDLLRFYLLTKRRPDAAKRLRADIASAVAMIEAAPDGGASFPRPYPELAWLAFRWVKSRIYWISWREIDGVPVITNVLHEAADLEGRASSDINTLRDW